MLEIFWIQLIIFHLADIFNKTNQTKLYAYTYGILKKIESFFKF